MNLSGLAVTLLDTAGLRESDDEVEQIGIDRGLQRAGGADLRVFLLDGPDALPFLQPKPADIVVFGKADLRPDQEDAVSGATGQGVDRLIDRIVTELGARASSAGVMTRERHRVAIANAISAIETAQQELIRTKSRSEFVAADLRVAVRSLDMLVGRIGVEDLLDEIFASFCIGK
jgi:tRNA modification GTPase